MFAASKTGGVVASSGDPYWTSVSLLTNFENNLTFQDGSTNNFAITRTGVVNPSLNTPFSGGVGGSEKYDGSTGYLTIPRNTAFDISTGDFTIELWFNTAIANSNYQRVFSINNISGGQTGSTETVVFEIGSTGIIISAYSGTTGYGATTPTALSINTWYHLALVRNGSTFTGYINGANVGSSTFAGTLNYAALAAPSIGAWNNSGYSRFINGFISNVRIVKGTAVYTANFTPPTAPLTAITNTSLLITGTGQGMYDNSTFVDQGPNALTVTATGAPVYSGLSPFGNTYPGSVFINNGASNRLSTPVNTGFDFGTGDFTIETWVNFTSLPSVQAIVTNYLNSTTGWTLEALSTGWIFYNGDIAQIQYVSTPVINTWYHIAVARSGTSLKMFLNGAQVASATNSTNITGSTNGVAIGALLGTLYGVFGYVSNLRVVKGTAVYTANFTPSTTPLTAITNTSLLVRGDTGAFYDLSIVGNPESGTGSPVVTTQVKKFGNESGSFNGTTSYLTTPDNAALNMGAADFTLEAWIYLTSTPALQANAGANVINKDGKFLVSWAQYNLYVNSALKVCANFSSVPNGGAGPTATIVGTTTLSLNTWYYVAVTRSGVNGTVWVNGASNGTTASIPATLANGARSLYIGYEEAQAAFAYFPGYIDDIRITKGVARTITTPTVTFPTGP